MFNKIILASCIFSILFCDIYNIDTDQSSIFWIGRKITGQHNGTIDIKNGYIEIAKWSANPLTLNL